MRLRKGHTYFLSQNEIEMRQGIYSSRQIDFVQQKKVNTLGCR